ncbi:TIGR03086 family metal-binding protein [Actinocatenispora rupis]|uniref:TIGR03086 family protein n=1 Tax=Actinocatenispora rupis TaxID=519421 RepID=A0A8J3J7B9_9ACTN|nr:TIGR03086 family metal-binding protein [Actinocatenispora rupis]GID11472.1 TIGR03086 family protein [Actinocatenispora rupis]
MGLVDPCTDWSVRALVNHVTRGNINYVGLLRGSTAAEFLRLRNVDALGTDPMAAFTQSAHECAEAFAEPGALHKVLDYPLGRVTARQLLAVRTTDTVVHTWDLARAVRVDDVLDHELVCWINQEISTIYAGLAETPVDDASTHRFFAAAPKPPTDGATEQDRLLVRMGRRPGWPTS